MSWLFQIRTGLREQFNCQITAEFRNWDKTQTGTNPQ